MKRIISFAFLLIFLFSPVFAASSSSSSSEIKDYEKEEFPEWAKHLRRTEIITFGSLPFVTIGVSFAYGSALYFTGEVDSFPNPLNKSENSYTEEQQLKIVGLSLGVSTIFGLTDLVINLIKSHKKNLENNLIEQQNNLIIVPLNENETVFKRKNDDAEIPDEFYEKEGEGQQDGLSEEK